MKSMSMAILALGATAGVALAGEQCGYGKADWYPQRDVISDEYCCSNCQEGPTFNPNVCGVGTMCMTEPLTPPKCPGEAWAKCPDGYWFVCNPFHQEDECVKFEEPKTKCADGFTYNAYLKKCIKTEEPCKHLGPGWHFDSYKKECVKKSNDLCPNYYEYNSYLKECIKESNPIEYCPYGTERWWAWCVAKKDATCPYGSKRIPKSCRCEGNCACTACPELKPCQHNNAANGDCSCFAKNGGVCPGGTTDQAKIKTTELRCYLCMNGFD